MESIQWFEIMKGALTQTEIELEAPQIEQMILIHVQDEVVSFSRTSEREDFIPSSLLAQAWYILSRILTNELQLETWNSLTIKGRKKAVTLYSLGFNLILMIYYEAIIDPMDVLKTLMKFVFNLGYKQKYDTVGLIASEGYPVWVLFPEGREMDEFLFAISITSLLTLVERIDMEVSAGGIKNCIIQGTDDLLLNVSFNPSQDLALAVTQKSTNLTDVNLETELESIYQKIVDPVIYSAIVPEITDEDREKMLKQILENVTGEATEEEIQTLNIFDSLMLQALENEIKMVQKRYGANEISIGYLRRRMRLPSEVLSMSLEYLIANGNIEGKIGKARQTGQEILVLDPFIERSDEDKNQLKVIQTQIKDLFIPLKPFLTKLPKLERPAEVQEVLTEALSEFQVMLTLSDTDAIFLLANDIRFNGSQLESAVKTALRLQTQIEETSKEDIIFSELERRYEGVKSRIFSFKPTINGQVTKFHDDLLNSYRLLSRLLPIPTEFKSGEDPNEITTIIKCHAHNCDEKAELVGNIETWIKLGVFSTYIGLTDDFPEGTSPLIEKNRKEIETQIHQLRSLLDDENEELEFEYYPYLKNIERLLITNAQRDEIITSLRNYKSNNVIKDFFNVFKQCNSCNRWFCGDKHISAISNKCTYC
jgi:predicted regulator of Ras-like GTPase activity (Roadblock/LC7/MglB family)